MVHYISLVTITKNRKSKEFILQGKGEQMHLAADVPEGLVGPYMHPLNIEVTENENACVVSHSHRTQDSAQSDQSPTMGNIKAWGFG